MKHLFTAIALCLPVLLSCGSTQAAEKNFRETELRKEIRNVRGEDGVDVIYVNRLLVSLAKTAGNVAVLSNDCDDDVRAALKLCRNVRSLIVVDYEDASAEVSSSFRGRVDGIFGDETLLLECCDEDESVRIYGGSVSEDSVRNLLIHIGNEALVYIEGSIRTEDISRLMSEFVE